jgi:Tfp pilus assembly protein PilE
MNRIGTRHTAHRQRGMTFLGLVILVAFVGLFVYAGIRLTPVYLEYMKVAKAMEALRTEGVGANQQALRLALERRFDIDDVQSITARDVEITRAGSNLVVRAAWERTADFVGNVQFLVTFDRSVEVPTT